MYLFLATSEDDTKLFLQPTKVRVYLRNGIATVLESHQDLMGKIENNLIEIETSDETDGNKKVFVLQDGIFVVSNRGLDVMSKGQGTGVYIFARRAKEVDLFNSIDDSVKEYDKKNEVFDLELGKFQEKIKDKEGQNFPLPSKLILLKDELEFLRKYIVIIRSIKKT